MENIMHTQGIITLALWMGGAAMALTLALILQVLVMRILLAARERGRQGLLARWRPLIVQSMVELPPRLPELSAKDFPVFALLWNHIHEALDGVSRDKLNELGYAVALDRMARDRLNGPASEEQLLAILTLGHLKERQVWDDLERLTHDQNPVVSITAARALVHIDPAVAMPRLAELIEGRDDWPLAKVGSILREAGTQAVTMPLAGLVSRAEGHAKVRLIRLLEYAQMHLAMPVVRALARNTSDPEVIAACLHLIRERRDAGLARDHLRSPDWRVRVQAALALGRVGAREDRNLLIELLQDSQWWVRYRAAQSLTSLPAMTLADIHEIRAMQTDPFARDMLGQVIAERYAS